MVTKTKIEQVRKPKKSCFDMLAKLFTAKNIKKSGHTSATHAEKGFPGQKPSKSEFLPFSIHSSSDRFDWISGLSGSFLRFLRAGMMARESRTEVEPG